MRYLSLAVAILTAVSFASAADNPYGAAPTSARVRSIVANAEQADLSPREPGILANDPSKLLGTRVDANQLVLQLDDTKAQQELRVAQAKYFAATTKADDDVNIKYSEAAAAVAKKDVDRNNDANRKIPGTVPQSRIEELQLKCTETSLAIDKAKHDRKVAEAEAGIAEAEVKAAETMIELLKVKSPIDGEVVEVRAHRGEAVQPTQPGVIHIVNLDKFWIEGQVSATEFPRDQLEGQPVVVEFAVAQTGKKDGGATRTEKKSVIGKVIFVSPLTETGGSYLVRAEVQREARDVPLPLHPGMQAEMVIHLKQ